MMDFLIIGITLGLSAGLSPGPLLTLVISETLQNGINAGVKVALAPVITDLPIVLLTLYLLSRLSHLETVLGVISIAGGALVLQMAVQNLRIKPFTPGIEEKKSRSLLKGIWVNALSPHPYLFWLSVGAPLVTKASQVSTITAVLFIFSFYGLLVGSKIAVSLLVGKSRDFLAGRIYLYIMRALGVILCILAFFLFQEGFKLLGLF
jgi:threonine/homoserine/homoserine lactone efflux protein